MNLTMIGNLIRLRYKLLWANTRTRNGRIALFFTGYLLLVAVFALLTTGGVGAGVIAVRSGKAELVAKVVLGTLFLQALVTSVILGFGLTAVFSELELRRYPVNARERFTVRHLIGIIDPFWFLILGLELGLVAGLYFMGATGFFQALVPVLLVFIANYLTARVLSIIIGRMMQNKAGGPVLTAFVLLISLGAGAAGTLIKRNPWIQVAIVKVLQYTAPFGAARAMTTSGSSAAAGYAVVFAWLAALTGALFALERRAPARQRAQSAAMSWDSPFERFTAWLGVENPPLVAYWLRFYIRNSRFRTLYLLALPLVGFLTFNFGRGKTGPGLFPAALGTFALVSFMGTSRFSVNQFGYAGGGFRRYFLLPVHPGAVLAAASRSCVILGAPLIPLAVLGWALIAPVPFDARMLLMLLGSGVAGLFALHGLGLWASIYGPRRGDYNQTFGNDLSLIGNIVVIGSVMALLLSPWIAKKFAPYAIDPGHWWITFLAAFAAWLFYQNSLKITGQLFAARREQLMSIVEGKG
jgi:hypothetical protein